MGPCGFPILWRTGIHLPITAYPYEASMLDRPSACNLASYQVWPVLMLLTALLTGQPSAENLLRCHPYAAYWYITPYT
ncbi:hypothetical protein Acife_0360 [Acidithiobacillus ferrivorans SS3]|uniref:Uncharacterized protein n=1 Tax=Acidithiobacillus ferrivorans SS3 TaxID=743299 RepID=G0JSN0_9PROT|nr:hypothetical protein Acife_0360 [Acidithiobacillus ferrivorans SS3]